MSIKQRIFTAMLLIASFLFVAAVIAAVFFELDLKGLINQCL